MRENCSGGIKIRGKQLSVTDSFHTKSFTFNQSQKCVALRKFSKVDCVYV